MSRHSNATGLQDTKALKKIGARLNTPVVHQIFSPAFDKCCDRLVYAQLRFLNGVFKYARGKNVSVNQRRQVSRRLDDIREAIRRSDAFAGRLGNANRCDQDRKEQDILKSFLSQRAVPFVEFWLKVIEALDDGLPPEIKPRDIPIWFEVPGWEQMLDSTNKLASNLKREDNSATR